MDELPARLENGTFTLDDLVHTSRQAIDRRVVQKGFAYWHRPQPGFDFLQYYVAYGGALYDERRGKLVLPARRSATSSRSSAAWSRRS